MLRTSMIAAVAAAAVAGPALAGSYQPAPADPVVPAPAPAPVFSGSDWTGAYAGASLGYGELDADLPGGGSDDADGSLYGLQVGYDYDFGTFVLGGELDYSATDLDFSGVDVDSLTRLKIRAGYDAGQTLIYGVAGAAHAETDLGDDNGWLLGVGADYKLTDNVTVGGEYVYHQFDDFDDTGVDIDGSTLAARVNYRF
ncbi:outer membrane protein [Pseudooceanicola sp. 200-1SW]|uniref:outer membrane protein n=1 Tax=Pseudooceanicola sp. 200-1SW TaxID=3425949 RepID=UPI003D7FD571